MTTYSWSDLFEPDTPAAAPVLTQSFRVLRRHGEPLLALPDESAPALAALPLYPAQSRLARFARSALALAVRCRLPVGERVQVAFSPSSGFPRFLQGLAPEETFPAVAILSGNPRSEGRRFLVLVCERRTQPTFVVKAGIGPAAKALIEREASFLESVPPETPGVPQVRMRFRSERLDAFALDFVPGSTLRGDGTGEASRVLSGWLDRERTVAPLDLSVWRQLAGSGSGSRLLARLEQPLTGKRFHPAFTHGDLAPWNIKTAAGGSWVVLDWERGELQGPPGWDWFHFVLQPALLVEKRSVPELAELAEHLLASSAFQEYARACGLSGFEKPWLLAYLLYQHDIIQPAEGLSETRGLLDTLAAKWLPV